MTKKEFNEFRFEGLNLMECSNKYYSMDRVSKDQNKIVVKVASNNIFKTKFGYALIIDKTRVVFIKDWQVDSNYFGIEVLLTRQYFQVKEFGEHDEFEVSDEYITFDSWLKVAQEQDNAENWVKWAR